MTAARLRAWALRAWVVLVFAFLLLPVVVVVLASLSSTSYLTVPPRGVTLRWFGAVLGDREYLQAIAFSLVLAVAASLGSLVAGVAASYAKGNSTMSVSWPSMRWRYGESSSK